MSRCGCTRHAIAHSTLSMSVMSMSSSTAMIHFKPCLTRELAAWSANAASPSGAPFFSEMAKNCELAPMPSKKLTPTRFGTFGASAWNTAPSKPNLRMQELSLGGISLMNACRIGLRRCVMALTSNTNW